MNLNDVTGRAIAGSGCSREEALELALETPLPALFASASTIREQFFGLRVEFCVIVNARSGACSENCRYCSQSAHNAAEAEVYPLMSRPALLQDAQALAASGANRYGIVTSGATVEGADFETVCQAIAEIGAQTPLSPCASLGRFGVAEMKRLHEAGLRRYHHNLETSQRFYPHICTTHDWQERVDTVRAAQEAGLEVCSGGLFGLGETWEDRIDLALTLRDLRVDCVPLNFLHAHPGTPLAQQPPLTADEALRIIAVYRHLLPKMPLRICGGRPKILGERQPEIFAAGANALMTGNYLTTSGNTPDTDRAMIRRLGLHLAD